RCPPDDCRRLRRGRPLPAAAPVSPPCGAASHPRRVLRLPPAVHAADRASEQACRPGLRPRHTMSGTSLNGLTAAEVAERVARGQVNRVRRSDWAEYRALVARNLFTLFNALVAPAAVALFLLGAYPDAWSVSALAVLNTVLGLVQE